MASVSICGSSIYVALLAVLVTTTQHGLAAFPNLHCDNVWKNSENNDVLKCLREPKRIIGTWRDLVLPALPLVFLVCTLLLFPICFCCTCLCASCCRASSNDGGRKQRCCLWMCIGFALIWAFGVAVFVFFGAQQLQSTLDDLLNKRVHRPLNFLNCTADKIIDFASNWTSGAREKLHDDIDRKVLDEVLNMSNGYIKRARSMYTDYVEWVPTVSYCIGGFAIAVMVPLFLFAYFRCCSRWLPRLLSCVYWVFAVVFLGLGFVILSLSYLFGVICGEMALHYDRKPGLIQWYGVPMCKSKFDFKTLNKMIFETQSNMSQEACGKILEYCDNNMTDLGDLGHLGSLADLSALLAGGGIPRGIDSSNLPEGVSIDALRDEKKLDSLMGANIPGVTDIKGPPGSGGVPGVGDLSSQIGGVPHVGDLSTQSVGLLAGGGNLLGRTTSLGGLPSSHSKKKFLKCGQNITNKNDCSSFGYTAAVITDTKVKGALGICPKKGTACTLQECAEDCMRLVIANEDPKERARQLVEAAELATNVSIGLAIGRPLLECNFIFDTFLTALPNCDGFYWGTMALGMGFFVGGLMFVLSIYILLRGSCIWNGEKRQGHLSSMYDANGYEEEDGDSDSFTDY